jgi:hypothetical protein
MPTQKPLPDDLAAKMNDFLDEAQRAWDAQPWHVKLRRRFEDWRRELSPKGFSFSDEQIARYPDLAEAQAEWDALPRRERLRQRFDHSLEYGLASDLIKLGGAWLVLGFVVFVAGGLIIKFLVPGGSEWLHSHTGLFLLICAAPAFLWLFAMLLWLVLGWVALPFMLAVGLWRRLRR